MNINQLKLQVHDSYKKNEKMTTNFEPVNNEDIINKAYLDKKLLELYGHLTLSEKSYNEFKLQQNKKSVEEILIRRAMKTNIQKLYDKGLFDNFAIAEEVIKAFCLLQGVEVI